MKTIAAFTISDLDGASARYRVGQYVAPLRELGYEVRLVPPTARGGALTRWLRRAAEYRALLATARTADLIWIQKRLFPADFIAQLARLGKPIVFDFDDAIFTSPTAARSAATNHRVTNRLHATLRASRAVLAGNQYLRDYAAPHCPRSVVCPTVVDLAQYPAKVHTRRGGECVVGWLGSRGTLPYLEALRAPLTKLAHDVPGWRLSIIADASLPAAGLHIDFHPWSAATELRDMLEFDVGLMPMPSDPWTRGKCGLKALQYMAAAIPPLCSTGSIGAELIVPGVDGHTCTTPADWVATLTTLLHDPALRTRLGAAAREKVRAHYDLTGQAQRLAELFATL